MHWKQLHTRQYFFLQEMNRYVHAYQKGASHELMVMMHHDLRILIGDLTLNLQKKAGKEEGRKESGWRVTLIQALLLGQLVLSEAVLRMVLQGVVQGLTI